MRLIGRIIIHKKNLYFDWEYFLIITNPNRFKNHEEHEFHVIFYGKK